ncbi:MAG: hypothetical protein ACYC5M_16945 [Anaerolineae bacterium]
MRDEDQMTLAARYRYLHRLHQRYDGADRPTRSKLLDEAEAVTGLNRKYLCHLVNRPGPMRAIHLDNGARVQGCSLDALAPGGEGSGRGLPEC